MQKIKITSCSDVNQFPKASGLFLQLCDPVEKQTRKPNDNDLLPMQLTKKCYNKITINKWFYGKEIEIALKTEKSDYNQSLGVVLAPRWSPMMFQWRSTKSPRCEGIRSSQQWCMAHYGSCSKPAI